jgi:diketogulonate reductase-like aldo/keto reductase
MIHDPQNRARRRLLRRLAALAAAGVLRPLPANPAPHTLITRAIPGTGETLPVIGMGSWITFDVGEFPPGVRADRTAVLQAFFDRGGGLVDSSPMYGRAEEVIGYALARIVNKGALFAASKAWTYGRRQGTWQMEQSRRLWGIERFDLMQVHNLLDWQTHLKTLKAWKAEGRVRYIGVTTSHGRRHDELERVMRTEPLDFVQFTYNLVDREAERHLLPLAGERGIATIINRPFRHGALFDRVAGTPLPGWAAEFDCDNWAQFFLKFIVAHPDVTCAIPATSKVEHMRENIGAAVGSLPDARARRRMIEYVEQL